MNTVLWIVQGLLAALFLYGGGFKVVMPLDEIGQQVGMPVGFLRFIGLAEFLGGLGLILPGLLRIRPMLTPLAALGLVIIMVGATVVNMKMGAGVMSLIPAVVGVLAAFVAYGRWRLVPHRGASSPRAVQPIR